MEPAGHSCWRKNRPRQISGAACNLFYPIRLYCTVVRIYPREQTMLLVQMFCWIPMLEFAGMYMPCQAISMPKKKSYQIVDCVDAASSGMIPVVKPDCKRNRVVSETRGSSLKSVCFMYYRVRVGVQRTCIFSPCWEGNGRSAQAAYLYMGLTPFFVLLCTLIVADARRIVNSKRKNFLKYYKIVLYA